MDEASIKEFKEKLNDRHWRINNLYYVKNEKGEKVKFKLNDVQQHLHDNLWFFSIVPKSRQHGITTYFTLLYFDQILFNKNKTATIIAHTQDDMKKIFKNKIKFAWDNLDPWVKEMVGDPDTNTANEMSFNNGSVISVALSSRSDTVQFLHISEFGKICQKYPDKAEEIVTGAINSVHAGQMVSIESTAAGREGYFYDFVQEAEKKRKRGEELSPLDFKIFFYPWWVDPRNTLEDKGKTISEDDEEYFKTLSRQYDIQLTRGQKLWYLKKKELNGDKVFKEYPSTLEECFKASTEGAYYTTEMNKVYTQGRIGEYPVVEDYPVETWWDLGMNDYNVILFVQKVGPAIRFVDAYANRGYGLKHYVNKLREKGYRYSHHCLPHDVEVRDLSTEGGISRKMVLYNLGLTDVRVAPKIGVQDGIEKVRSLFSRFYFDEKNCKKLYEAMENYRKEFDNKRGVYKRKPRKDGNDHWADAVRTGCALYSEPQEFRTDEEKDYWEKNNSESFFG